MQENNMRLIDEIVASEPIKNTFRLGWEFIVLNKPLTLTLITLLFVLSILGAIPIIGVVFSLFSSILFISVQIFIGRLVYESDNIEVFVDKVSKVKGEDIVKEYFSPALGAYAGWMVLGLLMLIVVSILIGSMGLGLSNIDLNSASAIQENQEVLLQLISTVALPMLIVLLILSYVQPLVQSHVVLANDFKEGFFAVMKLFSVDVWRDAFKGSYFKYMFWFSSVMLAIGLFFGVIFAIFGAIPFLNIFVVIVFAYVMMVIMTVAAMVARRVVE